MYPHHGASNERHLVTLPNLTEVCDYRVQYPVESREVRGRGSSVSRQMQMVMMAFGVLPSDDADRHIVDMARYYKILLWWILSIILNTHPLIPNLSDTRFIKGEWIAVGTL
jgi:hypothetical protein